MAVGAAAQWWSAKLPGRLYGRLTAIQSDEASNKHHLLPWKTSAKSQTHSYVVLFFSFLEGQDRRRMFLAGGEMS